MLVVGRWSFAFGLWPLVGGRYSSTFGKARPAMAND
jgi:hypothetical protein